MNVMTREEWEKYLKDYQPRPPQPIVVSRKTLDAYEKLCAEPLDPQTRVGVV